MSVTSVPAEKIAARLRMNPEFAQKIYDILEPGTTVIMTDQPVVRSRGKASKRAINSASPDKMIAKTLVTRVHDETLSVVACFLPRVPKQAK